MNEEELQAMEQALADMEQDYLNEKYDEYKEFNNVRQADII